MTDDRPIFYYAQGTSYLWNWFGLTVGSQGGGGHVNLNIMGNMVSVPDVYTQTPWGTIPWFGTYTMPSLHVKGLDGTTVLWEGGITQDAFPLLLDEELWQYKRVPYPASTLFIGPSIEYGVDWVIADILTKPVGTPLALGGYSQGAAMMTRLYDEFRTGRLKNRRSDLRAVVCFGNPRREQGRTFPGSSGYSGACDVSGDTLNGHGVFPHISDMSTVDLWVRRFARLQNTEDLVWEFTMPNEVISGVGDSDDGRLFQRFTHHSLRFIPLLALIDINAFFAKTPTYAVAPPGIEVNEAGETVMRDGLTNEIVGTMPGGGHIMYPGWPPPNADGTIPTSGPTCYQIAAQYLRDVGTAIQNELHPVVPAPTARPTYSWFSSLPGE